MPDPVIPAETVSAPGAPAAAAAPVVTPEAVPAAAPVAEVIATPTQAETPKAAEVAAPVETKVETKPEAVKLSEADSILGEAKTKEAEKPAEAKKADEPAKPAEEAKPAEAAKDGEKPTEAKAEPAPKPVYEKFTMPEGITFKDERLAKFTDVLSGLELDGKADHAAVQKYGQELVNLHIEEMQNLQKAVEENQRNTWSKLREEWTNGFKSDPEMGGNRQDTTIKNCGAVLEAYGQKFGADREAGLRYGLRISGMDNNPHLIRLLDWASRFVSERGTKPVIANSAAAPKPSKYEARYPTSRKNGAA